MKNGKSYYQNVELKKQADIETHSPMADNVKFKLVRKDKEDHFIFIKGKTNANDIIISNKNASNTHATIIPVRAKITDWPAQWQ